jgi:lysozyme
MLANMNASDACLRLIREFEGFRAKPYLCPAGIPTIGYGSTRYADGRPVSMEDPPITEEGADLIMRTTLRDYEAAVNRYVQVPLTQGQFDALVDFAYNAGAQNLRKSTLLRLLNAGDYVGAADQFGRWVQGGGRKLPGLVKRRARERQLFLGVEN